MFYNLKVGIPLDKVRVENLNGESLKREIRGLVDRIMRDDKGNRSPLSERSLVVGVHGGWGAGKTTAARAFVKHLEDKFKVVNKEVRFYPFDLLPFGNINESLNKILGDVATNLNSSGALDVRKEFKEVLADATPKYDIDAGVSLFGFKLRRRLTLHAGRSDYRESLRKKFSYFRKRNLRLVVMVDDLDRMTPEEMVAVSRMIEGFRDIPGIIFVLPFHRRVVASSIGKHLNLDEANSYVYLRKFINASITIEPKTQGLKHSFTRALSGSDGGSGIKKKLYGFNFENVAWFIFLHIAVLEEFINATRKASTQTPLEVFLSTQSGYMRRFFNNFHEDLATDIQYNDLAVQNRVGEWRRLGEAYYEIRNMMEKQSGPMLSPEDKSFVDRRINCLLSLQRGSEMCRPICPNAPYTQNDIRCACEDPQSHGTILSEFILHNAKQSQDEPLLASRYSRRDMEQIASAANRDFVGSPKSGDTPIERSTKLASIIYARFVEFL